MHILTRILTSRARGPQEGLPGARADRRGGARAEGQRPPEVDQTQQGGVLQGLLLGPEGAVGGDEHAHV